jgi:hypothetical protein
VTAETLLSAIAGQTASTARLVEGLAALIADLLADLPPEARGAALVRAQAADLAVQRLEGLAQVLESLGHGASAHDAVSSLGLADLAASLGYGSPPGGPVSAGDLALFD